MPTRREDGLNVFFRDITERKQREQERQEAAARQRAFLRDVLASVTEGRLRLCDDSRPPAPAPDPVR